MTRRMNHRVVIHGFFAGLAVTAALCAGGAARADQVTSKGTVLHGKITALSSSTVTFEPEYGKGSLDIKWENIEDLKTDGNFQVFHGDESPIRRCRASRAARSSAAPASRGRRRSRSRRSTQASR